MTGTEATTETATHPRRRWSAGLIASGIVLSSLFLSGCRESQATKSADRAVSSYVGAHGIGKACLNTVEQLSGQAFDQAYIDSQCPDVPSAETNTLTSLVNAADTSRQKDSDLEDEIAAVVAVSVVAGGAALAGCMIIRKT
jgi:hypothetical protein